MRPTHRSNRRGNRLWRLDLAGDGAFLDDVAAGEFALQHDRDVVGPVLANGRDRPAQGFRLSSAVSRRPPAVTLMRGRTPSATTIAATAAASSTIVSLITLAASLVRPGRPWSAAGRSRIRQRTALGLGLMLLTFDIFARRGRVGQRQIARSCLHPRRQSGQGRFVQRRPFAHIFSSAKAPPPASRRLVNFRVVLDRHRCRSAIGRRASPIRRRGGAPVRALSRGVLPAAGAAGDRHSSANPRATWQRSHHPVAERDLGLVDETARLPRSTGTRRDAAQSQRLSGGRTE